MQTKPKILFYKTYLTVIKNSVGSKMFQNFYVWDKNKKKDIIRSGQLACAFFVSNILHMFPGLKLISSPHVTVASTVADMQKNGWYEVNINDSVSLTTQLKTGSIVLWGPKKSRKSAHKHLGFYIGGGFAISHSDKKRCPSKHKLILDSRPIEKVFWHDALE